jgi:SAM-dependent methyltransferase
MDGPVLQHEYQVMHAQEMSHWWFRGRRRVLLDLIRRASRGIARPRILDYGCGTGGNTDAYTPLGAVVGIEPNADAVAMAHARGTARFCRGSGTELPFKAGAFDVAVASDVLEHIEDDLGAVREIARVLRPGGALVVSVPAHPWLFGDHDAALMHFRRYTRDNLRRALSDGGLQVEWMSYWNSALFPAVAAYRLLAPRRGTNGVRSHTGIEPGLANEPLAGVLALEARLLRYTRLPWGLSLLAIGRRG